MRRLLGSEVIGDRTEYWWYHTGPEGQPQVTVQTVQDVEPIFDAVKQRRDSPKDKDLRFKASIPATVLEEACRIAAQVWNVRPHVVFREVMEGKTDRAQLVMRTLTEGRDFRKFQAKG